MRVPFGVFCVIIIRSIESRWKKAFFSLYSGQLSLSTLYREKVSKVLIFGSFAREGLKKAFFMLSLEQAKQGFPFMRARG
jgi:hypothetical protein